MIFKNNQIYQLNHEEGRITYDYTNSKWVYEYDYRDHLGNLRLSFRDSNATAINGVYKPPVVVQANDYDPWGMELNGLNFEQSNKNNFKYQKQERINDFGLNWNFFKYRYSDSETGRFWHVDPLAEKYVYNSPYAFSENKVTNHIELEGLESAAVQALQDPKVQKQIKRATETGKEVFSVAGGVVAGGAGINVKAGKANLKLEASVAEFEVAKSSKKTETELKVANVSTMVGTEDFGIGGEINLANVQDVTKEKQNVRFLRVEPKGTLANKEITSDEAQDATLEMGVTFGAFTGRVKANFVKAIEYVEQSASAFGAFVTEYFNVSTNQTFTGKGRDEPNKTKQK